MRAATRWIALALSLWAGLASFAPTLDASTALSFDGTNDFVTVTAFGSFAPTNEATVEFWQKVDRVKIQASFMLGPDHGTNRFLAHVPYSDGRVYWDFGNYTNGGRMSYLPPVSLITAWHHFAFVASRTGNVMRIYRNGVLEASNSTTTAFTRGNYSLFIGGGPGFRLDGQLDEFRIWNVARSALEIQTNMNRTLAGSESNLIAYWRFDEGNGTVVGDSSGNGHTGVVAQAGAWVISTAPIGAPGIADVAALSVAAFSATLTGTVFSANQATAAWYEYGTTTNYGSFTATNAFAPGTNAAPFARSVAGLLPNTTYHFRPTATNSGGRSNWGDSTFTTPPASPTTTTLSANAITTNGARLRASVNPNGAATFAYIEYGLTTNYGTVAGTTNLAAATSVITFSNVVAGLPPGRTHQFRVVATNIVGTNFGVNLSFTTQPVAPAVTTQPADNVAATSARLACQVNPGGATTRVFFQYGTTTNYGSTAIATNLNAGNALVSVTNSISALLPGVLYHFRARATNVAGTNFGADLTFVTQPLRPLVTTLPATAVSTNGASLNASVNPNGADSTIYFEYGTTTNYGTRTGPINLLAGNSVIPVTNGISGLPASTLFHFRAMATNSAGSSFGVDTSFTTASLTAPPITSFAIMTNGAVRVGFSGAPGTTYTVLYTTNLPTWYVLGTATEVTAGEYQFIDSSATNSRARFYQLQSP